MRNPPSRVLLAAAVGVLLLAGAVAPVAGGAAASHSVSPSTSAVAQTDDGSAPTTATRIRIEPTPDRDARWIVSVRYALADETERAAFETIGDRFRNGEIGPSADLFAGFAREASRNIDRTMAVEGAEREVVVHEDPSSFDVAGEDAVAVGELRLTFVWTAFLAQDGEDLVLGDALTTPDGTWLRSLESGQTLEVATPDGYTVTSTTASLRDNAVVIEGPRTFDPDDGVAVVYASTATPSPPWAMLAAAIVIGALIIAGSIVGYRRREGESDDAVGDAVGDAVASTTNADASATAATDGTDGKRGDTAVATGDIDPDDTAETGDSGGAAASAERGDVSAETDPSEADPTEADASEADASPDAPIGSAESDESPGEGKQTDEDERTDEGEQTDEDERTDEIDRSLLSDEERVEYLLDDNGGRMRQADIVSETGWSDAKVSQLLSAMADEDRVEKLRLGRENLISLPDSGRLAGEGAGGDDGQDADDGGRGDGSDRD